MNRPGSGVRYVLERAATPGAGQDPENPGSAPASVQYRGFAHRPDADLRLTVTVSLPDGATAAQIAEAGADGPALERAAAALVRAATKPAVLAGSALPRKIVRWRAAP